MAFDVISMDPKYWYDKMIRELEQGIGETLYPGDERRIVAEELFYIIKYSLQGTTQGRYLTGGVPPVRFSM